MRTGDSGSFVARLTHGLSMPWATTQERRMFRPFAKLGMAVAIAAALVFSWSKVTLADELDGVVRIKSAYGMEETVARIKRDIAAKGILFFDEIRQSDLAGKAGIKLN